MPEVEIEQGTATTVSINISTTGSDSNLTTVKQQNLIPKQNQAEGENKIVDQIEQNQRESIGKNKDSSSKGSNHQIIKAHSASQSGQVQNQRQSSNDQNRLKVDETAKTSEMTAKYRPYRENSENEQLSWSLEHEPGAQVQIYGKTTETLPMAIRARKTYLIAISASCAISLILGIFIGYLVSSSPSSSSSSTNYNLKPNHLVFDNHNDHHGDTDSYSYAKRVLSTAKQRIMNKITAEQLSSAIRRISSEPRIPGTSNDLSTAQSIANLMRQANLDRVTIEPYDVLLSFPSSDQPNYVEILDSHGKTIYTDLDTVVRNGEPYPYCAYSPTADVTEEVVFVNYGRQEDYNYMEKAANLTHEQLSGKIFVAKQMYLAADEQVVYAKRMNASALLLYPDPKNYGNDGLGLPRDAVRRDSLLWNGLGDPLTPSYPALSSAYRLPIRVAGLPDFPVQPISYEAAFEILKRLGGREAPKDWSGGFNFTYKLGPGFLGSDTGSKVHVKINNVLKNQTIYNVIGVLEGSHEPDRYVIVGNHRDSWVRGAVDSASGAGALISLFTTFGDLLKTDSLRPRRTLIFASWGAEEFNLMGATEWLERHMKVLHTRAIAYLNVDMLVTGNGSLTAAASPLLYDSIFTATKLVPNPNAKYDGFKTIYDQWVGNFPVARNTSSSEFDEIKEPHPPHEYDDEHQSLLHKYIESVNSSMRPKVRQLDMRGVYSVFMTRAGIPAADLTFIPSKRPQTRINDQFSSSSSSSSVVYPLMHTQYDTFEAINTKIDPGFRLHAAITKVLGHTLNQLANSVFLPFNLLDYALLLHDFYATVHVHGQNLLEEQGIDLDLLHSAIKNFTMAAITFHATQDTIDISKPIQVRRLNDQLIMLERAFLDPNGLPRNIQKRHLVLSPSETQSPYDDMFPGIMDELSLIISMNTHHNDHSHGYHDTSTDFVPLNAWHWSWDVIRAHYSILVLTIQAAVDCVSQVVL